MAFLSRFGLNRVQTKPEKSLGGRIVRVASGDTLRSIALREYRDESHWRRIFDANRWKIDDPEMVYPGMDLRLP